MDSRTGESMNVYFDLTFFNESDMRDDALIAEMLAFAGIDEDTISIDAWQGVVPWRYYDFLLANKAVYEFARPYLRLRDFAMQANSSTRYEYEIVVTGISDILQQWDMMEGDIPDHFFPRFIVGISPRYIDNQELISEILRFAGLEESEVQFESMGHNSFYTEQDFLRVNEALDTYYRQWERLNDFIDLLPVRTVKRGLILDWPVNMWSPAGSRGDGSGFNVGFSSQAHMDNEELKEALLIFTGIDRDNIDFEVVGEFTVGWTPTRENLTPEQLRALDMLEAFVEKVNAPFWQDRYTHDPVVVRIELTGDWDWEGTEEFTLSAFTLFLYDPDLLDLTTDELADRTVALREEIAAVTGVEAIVMDVAR